MLSKHVVLMESTPNYYQIVSIIDFSLKALCSKIMTSFTSKINVAIYDIYCPILFVSIQMNRQPLTTLMSAIAFKMSL